MDKLKLLGIELFLMANRLEEIRAELFDSGDYEKLNLSAGDFLDQSDELSDMQFHIHDLAYSLNDDLEF